MCVLVHTRWIPHYGSPSIISSDLGPALIGEMSKFLCTQHGVQDRVNTILGLKCPMAEHRNKYLSEAITTAEAKGDIVSAEALTMVVANAQIRVCQTVKTDGSTVLERLHGVEPNTAKNLLDSKRMTADEVTAAIAKAQPEDKAFMRQLQARCDELIAWHNIKRDQRSRYQAANDLAKQSNLLRTHFGFKTRDKVAVGD